MDFIKEAFSRMDLPKLRSFLLYGSEEYNENVQPYHETLQKCSDPIQWRLEALCLDSVELDHATADLNDVLTVYQNIFMELEIGRAHV